jgi:hypothetical protein
MNVTHIALRTDGAYGQLEAQLETTAFGGESFRLWYRFPAEWAGYLDPANADFCVAALLLPAMVVGEPLELPARVSDRLLKAVGTIQDIYVSWYPALHRVQVLGRPEESGESVQQAEPRTAACFFSGGVDSMYTLLKQLKVRKENPEKPELKYLILVRGFDIPVEAEYDDLFQETLDGARVVAQATGTEVLPVATNIREFLDLFVNWAPLGHGPALASVGLALQQVLHEVYIASSTDYANLTPNGAHPLLDPLWSTETLAVLHDGCEATRLAKTSFIAWYPVALTSLRICYQADSHAATGQLNCGRCEKCLRTMIALHLAGALDRCEVLPRRLDLSLVRSMTITPAAIFLQRELLRALDPVTDFDRELRDVLEEALARAMAKVPRTGFEKKGVAYPFHLMVRQLAADIGQVVPSGQPFLLVDESHLTLKKDISAWAVPFPETGGYYAGPPADAAAAIQELERQRSKGVSSLVFSWSAFWWLDSYPALTEYLHQNYPCIVRNERLAVFDLGAEVEQEKAAARPEYQMEVPTQTESV